MQQTIFTTIIRLEKADLEVFIGVELVKASRQSCLYILFLLSSFFYFYFLIGKFDGVDDMDDADSGQTAKGCEWKSRNGVCSGSGDSWKG